MNDLSASRCPRCELLLPADSPAGLCPSCLLAAGGSELADRAAASEVPTTAQRGSAAGSPSLDQLLDLPAMHARFPQLEILEPVGQGGMGAVYKARQKSLDRFVALKVIRPDAANDPDFRERFVREARALARLNHPNIVGVHDFGQSEGSFYFIMEFVEGTSLRQLLQSGELTADAALALVPQICDALQYAHEQGIVHRDIKPENILIDHQGRVKIADFGLAKLLNPNVSDFTLTGTFQIVGTPRYMSPEQLEGKHDIDHRADIFSLGVVFYEMLTGELPLGRFDLPSEKAALDTRLDQVILRALENAPARRYQAASEVKSDVEAVTSGSVAIPTAAHRKMPGDRGSFASSKNVGAAPRASRSFWEAEAEWTIRVPQVVFALAACSFLCLMLPWSTLIVQTVDAAHRWTLSASGFYYWLPTFAFGVALVAVIHNAASVFEERPLNWSRSILSMATGVATLFAVLYIGTFEPLPNLDDDYQQILRQSGVGSSFSSALGSIRSQVRYFNAIDVRIQSSWGSLIAVVIGAGFFGIGLIEAAFVSRRAQRTSEAVQVRPVAGWLRTVAWVSMGLVPLVFLVAIVYHVRVGETDSLLILFVFGGVSQTFHAVLLAPLMLIGASRMEASQSRRLAVAISIMAMLPLGFSWILGLPVGVWSLLTLRNERVRKTFDSQLIDPETVRRQLRRAGRWMFIAATVSLVIYVVACLISAIMFYVSEVDRPGPRGMSEIAVAAIFGLHALPVVLMGLYLFAALKFWRAGSRAWSRAAVTFSLLPIHPGFVISLPTAIWTLCVTRQRLLNGATGRELLDSSAGLESLGKRPPVTGD